MYGYICTVVVRGCFNFVFVFFFFLMIRRPPRSTLFPYNDALPISPVEHFAEPERDRRARRAPNAETRPAGEVLTEVEHRFARRRSMDVHRTQLTHATHWWRHRCHERRRRRIEKGNRRPVAVVVRRVSPAAELPPPTRVVRLAAIDVRRENRPNGRLPVGIRYQALRPSALIVNLELRA